MQQLQKISKMRFLQPYPTNEPKTLDLNKRKFT